MSFNTQASREKRTDQGGHRRQVRFRELAKRMLHSVETCIGAGRALGPFPQRPPFPVRGQFGRNVYVHGLGEGLGRLAGGHRANVRSPVRHDGHGEEEASPLDEAGLHGQVTGPQFIAASDEVFQSAVGVAGRRLDAFHRQPKGSAVGQRLLLSRGNGPLGVGKLRVAVHAEHGLGEAFVQGHRFSNRLSRSDEA